MSPPTQQIWHFLIQNPRSCVLLSSPESMLRPTKLLCALQDQLAHNDAQHKEEHDEGYCAGAQALLFLHANRGVLR